MQEAMGKEAMELGLDDYFHWINFDNHDLTSHLLGVSFNDGDGDLLDLDEIISSGKVDVAATQEVNTSHFDSFVNQFQAKKIPDDILVLLARMLCEKATGKAIGHRGDVSEAKDIEDDEFTGCAVSWDGVSQQWFSEVFMKTSEVEQFLAFGCRMWFVREYGIKEMLHRRGVTSGSAIDHMEKFVPAGREVSGIGTRTAREDASVFISFTGSYTLSHFANLIQHKDLWGQYLWIDTFCVDQIAWKSPQMKPFKKDFMHKLRERVCKIGFTALMLKDWDDLMLTLGQIWVIWEVFSTASGGAKLQVLLDKGEHTRFVKKTFAGGEFMERVRASIADIDASKAGASQPEDQKAMLEIMEEEGVLQVNACVIKRMHEWLSKTCEDHIKEREILMGDPALKLKTKLAHLLSENGNQNAAENLYRDVLVARKKHLDQVAEDKQPSLGFDDVLRRYGNVPI